VVSKNDLDLVRAALREHPGMTLREDDLVRVIANWRPKHDNLTELAAELNLGVDSLVFVDDSPFECGLVRQALPEVAVVQLDAEPALHAEKLLQDGWFDTVAITEEDRSRPARYREERARSDFLSTFDSLDGYLGALGVWVRFEETEPDEVARVAQITLRTNQFNLTTERLQEPDVRRLMDDPAVTVYSIHSGDRFGSNGLVGAIIARRDGRAVHIDNFLLSCRVFARGIEQACLSELLRVARADGADAVVGRYRPTRKNGTVADLYSRNGFTPLPRPGDELEFRHDLIEILPVPSHVRVRSAEGTTA
jgi:FkbH-like protein